MMCIFSCVYFLSPWIHIRKLMCRIDIADHFARMVGLIPVFRELGEAILSEGLDF